MEKNKRYGWGRCSVGAAVVAGGGAAGVVWLAPGGARGSDGPVRVTAGLSARAYRAVNGHVADGPAWIGSALEVASEGTLVVLGLLLALAGWRALRRRDVPGPAGVAVAAIGTVVAYGLSEAVKLLVDEERPCRALPGVSAFAVCPEPGDWSFPSNHATLAVALAVGVTLLRPRLAFLALPVAGAATALRVLVGVHYPHDVLAGATLGATAGPGRRHLRQGRAAAGRGRSGGRPRPRLRRAPRG